MAKGKRGARTGPTAAHTLLPCYANVLFDAQAKDPVGPEKKQSMVYSVYRWGDSDTYAGWEGVENSALALAEMAPILLTPRLCANGIPAPVMQPDWKKAVEGLVLAGEEGTQGRTDVKHRRDA